VYENAENQYNPGVPTAKNKPPGVRTPRTAASSKSAGAPGFHGGHEDRSAEGSRIEAPKASRGWGIGTGVPIEI